MNRSNQKKVSDEVLFESYERLNNVWRVAEEVGLCGQSVHERLVKAGKINKINHFTESDREKLKEEYQKYRDRGDLESLAASLGRTKQFICRQAKSLGLTSQGHDKSYLRKPGANPYARQHARVRKLRGQPRRCEVCGDTSHEKTYDWANLTGDYDNPDDYKRMCRPCHRFHDKGTPALAHPKKPQPKTVITITSAELNHLKTSFPGIAL